MVRRGHPRNIDEALTLLDGIFDVLPTVGPDSRTLRLPTASDPVDAVLSEAATIAQWASKDEPKWLDALGAIAERTGHSGCASRFVTSPRRYDGAPFDMWDLKDRII